MTVARWKPHDVRDAGRQDTRLYRLEQLQPAATPTRLAEMGDVAADNPSDGQGLLWDPTAALWKPGSVGGSISMRYANLTAFVAPTSLPLYPSRFTAAWAAHSSSGLTIGVTTSIHTNDTLNFPAGLFLLSLAFNVVSPQTSTAVAMGYGHTNLAVDFPNPSYDWALLGTRNVGVGFIPARSITSIGAIGSGHAQAFFRGWVWYKAGGTASFTFAGQAAGDSTTGASISIVQLG